MSSWKSPKLSVHSICQPAPGIEMASLFEMPLMIVQSSAEYEVSLPSCRPGEKPWSNAHGAAKDEAVGACGTHGCQVIAFQLHACRLWLQSDGRTALPPEKMIRIDDAHLV